MSDPYSAPDHLYRRLHVGPGASRDEIVHAYRRLAHGAHPDVHPGDPDAERRFREITEAYEVLADPSRRARYDRAGAAVPIRVSVRAVGADASVTPGASRRVGGADPTVVLGAATPSLSADVPLRAGPARVERAVPRSSSGRGPAEQTLAELFGCIVEGWGRV